MMAVFQASQSQAIANTPLPLGFSPEGVAQTCFDSDLLYLVERAIPPSIGGQKIFAHLLLHATLDPRTSMQHSLFHTTGEYGDEAIVLINSIDALARTPNSPCAPETYHKVLLAFEAMQVIRRQSHRNYAEQKYYTEIRIPLGKRALHLPTLLEGLHRMYSKHGNEKGTNKFQKFALRVAARLQSSEFARFRAPDPLKDKLAPEQQAIAQVLTQLLREHNVKEVRIPSLNEACSLLAQAIQKGRVNAKAGESVTLEKREGVPQVGESAAQMGEFVNASPEPHTPTPEYEGEFGSTNSPVLPAFSTASDKKTRPFSGKLGELETIFKTNSPENGKKCSKTAHSGEFVTRVTYNGYISPENITSNHGTINDMTSTDSPVYKDPRPIEVIRHDAAELAKRLDGEEDSRWFGRFVKTVQLYPPQVRRLAEIDVWYHSAFYQKRADRPGAVFFNRCDDYANPQFRVKDEVRRWDLTGLSIDAIRQELQSGISVPTATMLPFASEQPADDKPAQAKPAGRMSVKEGARGDLGAASAQQEERDLVQRSLLHTRMNLKQAQDLCQQIRLEGQPFRIRAEVYEGDRQGEFVVVTNWDGAEDEWENAAAWNRHFEKVRKCYEN